jgi:uncharacterized membrane protein YoaK (UPF0700 family)
MKLSVPSLLALNAGYVDTAGFLALQGLFTAHVTGNFVTLGATLAHGTSGATAKLAALPTFCLVVVLARLLAHLLTHFKVAVLRPLLGVKVVLLTAAAILALRLGPFPDGDSLPALATGLTLVAAMAIQNAVHRVHSAGAPPTTLMTGTSTQIMLDLADLVSGQGAVEHGVLKARLARFSAAVAAFALGCGLAALAVTFIGMWCFVLPPAIALVTLLERSEKAAN